MTNTPPLIITDFLKGIAPSPYLGYGHIRGLDIYTYPGIIRLNNKLEKKSSTTVTSKLLWILRNPRSSTELFALDYSCKVYTSTDSGDTWSLVSGNTTTSGFGQGMVIWKDYLIVARNTALDIYGPLSSSPVWTNSWKTIDSDTSWHPMIVGQDDIVYGGAGRYIFTLEENVGTTFAPGTSSTYTYTQQALDLPSEYRVKCLAELGENLMIGTWVGANPYEFKIAKIFPWNRSTASSFRKPIELAENGVHAMINIGNLLYFSAGIEGKIFVSNGTSSKEISRIPNYIMNLDGGKWIIVNPGAMISHQGRILIGIGSGNNLTNHGVWSLKPNAEQNTLVMENPISTGNDGTTNGLEIGALLSTNRDIYLVGWLDDTTYGIDKLNNSRRITSYGGYFDSPYYTVGSAWNKAEYRKLVVELARPLASGQGVKVAFRTSLDDSFTTIQTFDYSTYGAVKTLQKPFSLIAEKVQFRVSLTTGDSNLSPELITLALI